MSFASLILLVFASLLQVAHIHGRWLPDAHPQVSTHLDASQLPGDEEHCPLCVAMHSALPTEVRLEPAQTLLYSPATPPAVELAADSPWHFAMFSRPPPALENR